MRTFVKSIVFAVAVLLSVSVWAGNPEHAPVCNNVQHAVTVQPVNEVKDVQQIPCVIYVNICGKYVQLPAVFLSGCNEFTIALQTLIDDYTNC